MLWKLVQDRDENSLFWGRSSAFLVQSLVFLGQSRVATVFLDKATGLSGTNPSPLGAKQSSFQKCDTHNRQQNKIDPTKYSYAQIDVELHVFRYLGAPHTCPTGTENYPTKACNAEQACFALEQIVSKICAICIDLLAAQCRP